MIRKLLDEFIDAHPEKSLMCEWCGRDIGYAEWLEKQVIDLREKLKCLTNH